MTWLPCGLMVCDAGYRYGDKREAREGILTAEVDVSRIFRGTSDDNHQIRLDEIGLPEVPVYRMSR